MRGSWLFKALPASLLLIPLQSWSSTDPWLSDGRAPDPSSKALSEIRDAEQRRIPLDVELKASSNYSAREPVEVTVMVTNLFDRPLILNRRMLVNHPRLSGEIYFKIDGPDGGHCEIRRLITPLGLKEDDFVVLKRGESIQRTIDLADLYTLKKKGVYKVQVSYRNEADQPFGTISAWKGDVSSDPIEFRLD